MAGYDRLVKSAIKAAFRQAGDLTKEVQFVASQPTGFDFSACEATLSNAAAVTLRVIVTDTKRQTAGKGTSVNPLRRSLLLQSADAPAISDYDNVIMDGEQWRVVKPIANDGFLITVDVTKEG